jgi:hypothetical protein
MAETLCLSSTSRIRAACPCSGDSVFTRTGTRHFGLETLGLKMDTGRARPHISSSIGQLEALFESQKLDHSVLEQLLFELSHRKTTRATRLRARVADLIGNRPASNPSHAGTETAPPLKASPSNRNVRAVATSPIAPVTSSISNKGQRPARALPLPSCDQAAAMNR